MTAGLLTVVALGSRGLQTGVSRTVSGGRASLPLDGSRTVAASLLVLAAGGLIGVTLVGAIALAAIVRPRRKNPDELFGRPWRPPWWSSALALAIAVALIGGTVALFFTANHWVDDMIHPGATVGHPSSSANTPAPAPPGRTAQPVPLGGAWFAAAMVAIAVIAGAALWLALERRPSAIEVGVRERKREVAHAIEETIDDIRREPDPRRAVIRAYVRMERDLTALGWPRRPSRTASEYLEETLRRLEIPVPAARALTELFTTSRFGRRTVDPSMKQRAIDCLLDVRRALAIEVT